jgi:hydrogenase/urease accessory protein HupE
MVLVVFTLCALTSLACAVLLIRAYSQNRVRLLLWSGLCFIGLALNNALLIVDVIILPDFDLAIVRSLPAVVGMLLLVYGLVWETR